MVEELKLETEYKGFKIRWDAYSKQWDILLDGKFLKRQETPDKAQEYIDKLEKSNFVRQPVLLSQGYDIETRYIPATATSMSDGEVWVITEGGKRSREEMRALILDTPENRASIKELLNILQQVKNLNKKAEILKKGMTRLTSEMMVKELKDATNT